MWIGVCLRWFPSDIKGKVISWVILHVSTCSLQLGGLMVSVDSENHPPSFRYAME